MFCQHLCQCIMPMPGPLELELWMIVRYHVDLGIESGSSRRILMCLTFEPSICLAPIFGFVN